MRGLLVAAPALALLLPLGPALAVHAAQPLPMARGSFAWLPEEAQSCAPGFTCLRFEVACATTTGPVRGTLALAAPEALLRGALLAFGGGNGVRWWSQSAGRFVGDFVQDALRAGLVVAQVR